MSLACASRHSHNVAACRASDHVWCAEHLLTRRSCCCPVPLPSREALLLRLLLLLGLCLPRPLQPGHTLTIEPGLYIPDEPRFGVLRGIGVRIEDDVAIHERGCEVLSAAVPTAVKDLEELVGRQQRQ